MRLRLLSSSAALLLLLLSPAGAEDRREMVAMPEEAQHRLLQGMHDHMSAFASILSYIANEHFESAARLAETQLPIGPMDPETEQDMLAYLPSAMLDGRSSLKEAGKRLAVTARRAAAEHSYYRMRKVAGAVADVQAACAMCHAHYRIR
ncbi:MAG: hypothetical protein HY055_17460 [Magnetospirillum sp.]|nr:hypothetical protein [Magnetospirillum sp.]